MYQQRPGQNQQIFAQNYGIPGKQNPVVYANQGHFQNTQNIQLIPNAGIPSGDKRKTFSPNQYQKGNLAFQPPQLPNKPKQEQPKPQGNYISASMRPPLIQTINPIIGFQPINPNPQGKPIPQQNPLYPQVQQNTQLPINKNLIKTPTLMTVNTLSDLPYSKYEKAEYSHQPFYNISGYASNSYYGKVRGYNEDRTKTIVSYQKPLVVNGKKISPRISYFSVFDGHGGEGCSNFLKEKLDSLLFNSKFFPGYPIQAVREAFINAENLFLQKAIDHNKNVLVDQSGSCACVMLIINDILYAINLVDCRALLSTDSGQTLRQITRDHKPNDPIEKRRIEKSGAQVYYANKAIVNGKEVVLRESDYGVGFHFPYRINPGGISVSFYYIRIYNNLGFKNYWRLLC